MRSLLFVPADSEKKLAKGLTSGADALIVDLEDSVAPEGKAAARVAAAEFIKAHVKLTDRPRLFVRINALITSPTASCCRRPKAKPPSSGSTSG